MQDQDQIQGMRNRVLYSDYSNSLIAWTLSPEWLTPTPSAGFPRGLKIANSGDICQHDTAAGEFDAK